MLKPIREYTVTTFEALDVMSGRTIGFLAEHDGTAIFEIYYADGGRVAKNSEQFTEAEAALLIDLKRAGTRTAA